MQALIWAILDQDERTNAWLARKVGCSRQYVYQVRTGALPPSADFRRRCAQILGRAEADLFHELPTDEPANAA